MLASIYEFEFNQVGQKLLNPFNVNVFEFKLFAH